MNGTRSWTAVLVAGLLLAAAGLGACGEVSTSPRTDVQGGDTQPIDDTVSICTPACDWRQCGVEPLCGASCGICGEGEECREGSCIPEGCEPDCSGLDCGLDPVCGAVCGKCADDQHCEAGACVEGACEPDCSTRQCGPDPVCLESCGTCAEGSDCLDGTCVPEACVPDCSGLQCGPDPVCQEECGPCLPSELCEQGSCVPGTCVPNCADLDCGPDPVCGTECGPCAAGTSCAGGLCVPDSVGACANEHDLDTLNGLDPVAVATTCVVESGCGTNAGCIAQCVALRTGMSAECAACTGELGSCGFRHCLTDCIADQGGPVCRACLDENCAADFEACAGVEQPTCSPDCADQDCGPDPVCGQSCGGCDPEEHCENGTCVGGPCVPSCGGQDCGPDPVCGEDCGPCAPGSWCDAGTCVPRDAGACANETDLGVLNETDPVPIAQQCLMESDCGNDVACISACIAGATGISGECAACYGGLAVCALGNCIADCVLEPGGPDCIPCLDTHCMADFEACAGIRFAACEPDCSTVACGPDPVCGESCGTCGPGERCTDGACVPADDGACVSMEDLELLNELDPVPIAEQCLLRAGCGNHRACIAGCIADESGISRDCADCYAGLAVCGLASCLQDCVPDPAGESCTACLELNCMDGFEACAGIRLQRCEPACGEQDCGPDPVCGASCGDCGAGAICEDGTCVATPGGACNNAEDLPTIAAIADPGAVAASCLLDSGCGMDESCIAGCIGDETGLTGGCSMCFAEAGICAATLCLVDCFADFSSPDCVGCIRESCGPDFEVCAGLAWVVPL